ncbi:MAG: TonB-dependent receptor plug domain-containing protein, partial [Paludibacter sp.]|nr:TonB-dependent receptor plug domain-containing protein [Paludibacter sp.]
QIGVFSHDELTSQYSVRGGNFDENSVYVNGMEIYRPLLIRASQQEGLSFINPDMVGAVEFSAGGFAAKYGDKMSSVLDVTYKTPKKSEASVSASFMGVSAYVGSSGKRFTQSHSIRYKTNQYLLRSLDTKGDFNNSFLDYQTFMTLNLSGKWSLNFLGNISQNNYIFQPQKRETEFGTIFQQQKFSVDFHGQEKDVFTTYFGALSLNFVPNSKLKLTLNASAFNTQESETYDITGFYSLSDVKDMGNGTKETIERGSGATVEHARNRLSATVATISHSGDWKIKKVFLQWGLSASEEIIFDKLREWERHDSAQYSLPHNGETANVIYNLKSDNQMISTRLQAFIQQTYSLKFKNALYTFNVGVRGNYWSFNKEWLFSPRLSIAIFPEWKQDFTFRIATGLYYQSPFYKEVRRTITDGNGNDSIYLNHNIRAQRSLHFLLGGDYFFRLWSRPFKFTTEIYYKPSDRITSYSVDNVRIRYSGLNDARAYTVGADFKLFGEFVPGADSWISFSWMRSKEDLLNDTFEAKTTTGSSLGVISPSWISRPNEQRYSVSIFFQDYVPNHPEYKVNLKLVWADGLPYGPPRSERYLAVNRAKPYRRVDIGASRGFKQGREKFMTRQKVVKEFWLNLDLLNLFNIQNVSSYYWVSDINNAEYAVPNYLTGFMVNFRVSVDF